MKVPERPVLQLTEPQCVSARAGLGQASLVTAMGKPPGKLQQTSRDNKSLSHSAAENWRLLPQVESP